MGRKGLWVAAGGGLALLLLASSGSRTSRSSGELSDQDLEALTRMLITETSFALDPQEMAQIVWVAVNRAKKNGRSLFETVYPPGKPTWNTGAAYKSRYVNAHKSSRWAAARAFVQDVLAGGAPNAGYTKFVHPRGMPTPPCASNRQAVSTPQGVRCLPSWIAKGDNVGSAMFA